MPSNGRQGAHLTVAIGVCVILNMFDGFDVLVISLTAPGIGDEWSLTSSQLGLLFSAGLLGMVVGSLFVAPVADRLGRRAVVLACILVVGVGMVLAARANHYLLLAIARLITGIGVAGILACAVVLVSEYSSDQWRNTGIFLYTFGYSVGATGGGAVAALLIRHFSWRAAFALGAAASFLMLPAAFRYLPESNQFLAKRGSLEAAGDATGSTPRTIPLGGVAALLSRGSARVTLFLWAAFFFAMSGYYFVFSWTPKLLTAAGLSAEQGVSGGVLLSLGGMGGTLLFALVGRMANVRRVAFGCLLAAALLTVVFSLGANKLSLAFPSVVALGAASTSALAGFYAVTPGLYGAEARSSGMGWAVGVGRIGAILASLAAGLLVDRGWSAVDLLRVFSGTFLLASIAFMGIRRSKGPGGAPFAR
jgi:MFS family permease